MPSVERPSLTKKHGWLVWMVDGKKKLGLNERELRAAENRKRLAQEEEMKIQRRRRHKETKPARRKSSRTARRQKPERNKMHLALMHEGKKTKRQNERTKPAPKVREILPSTACDQESEQNSNAKSTEILSILDRVYTAIEKKGVDNDPPEQEGVNAVNPEEKYLHETRTNEVSPKPLEDPKESDISYILSLGGVEENQPEAETKKIRPKQPQEETLQEATINKVSSQPKLKLAQSEPTRLHRKKRKSRRGNKKKQDEGNRSSVSYRFPRSKTSDRNILPITMKLKEVETQAKNYKTQVFKDWKKQRKSSIKRRNTAPEPEPRYSRKLTGLDPEVIAITQQGIAECAEREARDSALTIQRKLTGLRAESESKMYISGWLENLESPKEAIGGLY